MISCLHSLLEIGAWKERDNAIQISSCTFDAHVQEILGTLCAGSTTIMLQPHGNMNLLYLSHLLHAKEITYMLVVPTFIHRLLSFMQDQSRCSLSTVQTVCCMGK